jgi:hypothetical protein
MSKLSLEHLDCNPPIRSVEYTSAMIPGDSENFIAIANQNSPSGNDSKRMTMTMLA